MQMPRWTAMVLTAAVMFLGVVGASSPANAAVGEPEYYPMPHSASFPSGFALTPNGRFAFISSVWPHDVENAIYKFDTTSNDYVSGSTGSVRFDSPPTTMVVSPDSRYLYVSLGGDASVDPYNLEGFAVVDIASMSILSKIDLSWVDGPYEYPSNGQMVILNHQGTRAYVIGGDSGSIYSINISNPSAPFVADEVFIGPNANAVGQSMPRLALTPDGSKLFVTQRDSNPEWTRVSVIKTQTFTVVGTLSAGPYTMSQPFGIAISPDGEKLFISDEHEGARGDDWIYVFNAETNAFITRFLSTVPDTLNNNTDLIVSPDGSQVAVVNSYDWGSIAFYDTANYALVQTLRFVSSTSGAQYPAFNADGSRLFMACRSSSGILAVGLDPALTPASESDSVSVLADTGFDSRSSALLAVGSALLGLALIAMKRRVR
jgi:LPXTG-motif cell wall-anchored protein